MVGNDAVRGLLRSDRIDAGEIGHHSDEGLEEVDVVVVVHALQDVVFDHVVLKPRGEGSTILAAHQLGRIGYGCEIDPGYVAVTLERLSALGLKPELVQ